MVIDLERIRRATQAKFCNLDIGLLRTGWWNPDWDSDELALAVRAEMKPGMHVLECGSGLTTIMLAMALRDLRVSGVSLEENFKYARLLKSVLLWEGLDWTVIESPVVGGWYSVTRFGPFDLVICDGPAGDNRIGLMKHMREYMANALILFDDAERDDHVLCAWEADGAKVERRGRVARVRL